MKRVVNWAARLLAFCLLLVLGAGGLAYTWLKTTVPALSGTLAITGLTSSVEIVRDNEGVPHIFAATVDDAFCALGYVHAQDRLWQMELARRAGQGRLSEIFGQSTFERDVLLRTLDLYGHAERSLSALSPIMRSTLDAYARGVNAFIGRSTHLFEARFPPEFQLLWHRPEPWRPADSMVIMKLAAMDLGTNLNHEITRLALAAQGLSPEEIDDVLPPDRTGAVPPLPDLRDLYPLRRPSHMRAAIEGELDNIAGGASNNWVVAGTRTRSGKPLLANDPHLELTAPSLWYLAHLALGKSNAPVNVVGATLAGIPLVMLGRTDTLAWGFTNTGADVQDLFVEKLNPTDADLYLTPEGWRPLVREAMTIAVRGAGVKTVERRRTRHGPVLPASFRNLDQLLAPGYVAALQWTALSDDDATIEAGAFEAGVRSVQDYMQRMRGYVVPMQSMVIADVDGNIGMIAPGRIPVRDAANRVAGRAPVPGWDATFDWKGYLPFEDLPRFINPPAAAIGTANAPIVGPDYPNFLTYDWDAPFRQERINALIINKDHHDSASMRAAQADVLSGAAVELKPLMIAAARRAGRNDAMLDALERWDGSMDADRAEPLVFTAWERETILAIYEPPLGVAFERFFGSRALALIRLLRGRATSRNWCQPGMALSNDGCDVVVARAFTSALADLQRRYGADRRAWRWGKAHIALGEHRPFGLVPGLSSFFNVEVPIAGGTYTLNRGIVAFRDEPIFASHEASSFRAIYDFSDLDRSLYIQSTGQSGNPFSPFYRSFVERWRRVEYITIPTRRADIAGVQSGIWMLKPTEP